jgi:hypothetical protein
MAASVAAIAPLSRRQRAPTVDHMPGGSWGGVLYIAEVTVIGAAVLWCVLNLRRLAAVAIAAGRRLRLLPPELPAPTGMRIERIAADLRRIRPLAMQPLPGMPMVRRRAIVAAYDDALLDACHALGVATELDRITDALERESERLRTEHQLAEAGVDLG